MSLDTADCLSEVNGNFRLNIAAALGALLTSATEKTPEKIADILEACSAKIKMCAATLETLSERCSTPTKILATKTTAPSHAGRSELIILAAFIGIAQDLVGFVNLLEFISVAASLVGVVFVSQSAKSFFDFCGARVAANAQ